MSVVVVGFITEATDVVVELVGGFRWESPPIEEGVSGDKETKVIFGHGLCLVGWLICRVSLLEREMQGRVMYR